MSNKKMQYKILLPENFYEAQKEGCVNDIILKVNEQHSYRLLFMDFYRFTEEFMRYREFYNLNFYNLN